MGRETEAGELVSVPLIASTNKLTRANLQVDQPK